MAAHIAEVLVWSLACMMVGAALLGTDFTYVAFVTTLGYGDVTPRTEQYGLDLDIARLIWLNPGDGFSDCFSRGARLPARRCCGAQ
jgi:hypothetical protein